MPRLSFAGDRVEDPSASDTDNVPSPAPLEVMFQKYIARGTFGQVFLATTSSYLNLAVKVTKIVRTLLLFFPQNYVLQSA